MATLFDEKLKNTPVYTPEQDEAAIHNARIRECYRRLKNEEEILRESDRSVESEPVSYAAPSASVLAPERPQTPADGGFVHTRVDSPLFTPETLDKTIRENCYDFAPTEPPVEGEDVRRNYLPAGGTAVAEKTVASPEAVSYALNARAMKAIAAFTGAVIAMLGVIGVNSYVIKNKTRQLKNLEQQRERLVEQKEEIEQRIRNATSPETIFEYATEKGMVIGK